MSPRTAGMLAGAFGGLAPSLSRVGTLCTGGNAHLSPPFMLEFGVGLVIFAVIGGVVTRVYRETHLAKALLIGVSLPATLQIGTRDLTASSNSGALSLVGMRYLVGDAYAQPASPAAKQPPAAATKTQTLVLSIPAKSMGEQYSVIFADPTRSKRVVVPVRPRDKADVARLDVPEGMTAFSVACGSVQSSDMKLGSGVPAATKYLVRCENVPWAGFRSAFGVSNVSPYRVVVSPEARAHATPAPGQKQAAKK